MSISIATKFYTSRIATVITPYTNSKEVQSSILPPRFNSTSSPSESPIVSPELTSTSGPKLKRNLKQPIKPADGKDSEKE